jgi:hypothetical protein
MEEWARKIGLDSKLEASQMKKDNKILIHLSGLKSFNANSSSVNYRMYSSLDLIIEN